MIYPQFDKELLKWLLIHSVVISILPFCYAQANNLKGQDMSMNSLIDSLLVVKGQEYINKETQLRQGGRQAISALKIRLNDNDAFTRFYANTIINWMEGRSPKNDVALAHLDNLPAKLAKTPITSPSPSGTAAYLDLHFQSSVTDILAVQLIKLPDLEYWRVMSVLFYLEIQKSPDVTDILLRFVLEAKNDDYIEVALNIIDATKDPQLRAKIIQEELRLKSLNLSLPTSLKTRY